MQTKYCNKCGIGKELEAYSTDKRAKDGRQSTCRECTRAYQREKYAIDPEYKARRVAKGKRIYGRKALDPEWMEKERQRKYPLSRAYWEANKDKMRADRLAWGKANRAKLRAILQKYRAAKIQRTPPWLTTDDFWMIEEAHRLAVDRTKLTGFAWHVDHVVPLQGDLVSGLHVPWNLQVIPAADNVRKNNKFEV